MQFRRDGQPFVPFADVSFSLEAGCLYNLTGPSGSGKSTLLNASALMLPRSGGTLALEGVPVDRFKPTEWRRRVCLVPQAASLVSGTVRDNLLFPWTLKVNAGSPKPDDDVLNEMLSLAMLDGVTLDHAAAQLSGGQLARVALLRAFATRPTVLLLDEVEAALDEESAVAVSRLRGRCSRAGPPACASASGRGWLRVRGVHAGRWEDDLPSKRDHGRQRTRYKCWKRMRLASR